MKKLLWWRTKVVLFFLILPLLVLIEEGLVTAVGLKKAWEDGPLK